jgi:hypothetical protein
MTDKQTPPDWVLIEAAERIGKQRLNTDRLPEIYAFTCNMGKAFRALCDMIERYEQPPVDRKLLCAREAMSERFPDLSWDENDGVIAAAVRAIELWDEGFGK